MPGSGRPSAEPGGPAADEGGVRAQRHDRARPARPRGPRRRPPVQLGPREYQILAVLLAHPGRLVTRGRLLRAVWGEAYAGEDHYVHVYVEPAPQEAGRADPGGELADLIVTEAGRRLPRPGGRQPRRRATDHILSRS